MTTTVKNIIPRKISEVSQTTQYTATNCKCRIDKFTGTNYSAATATISINLVASGGSAENKNLIIKNKSIAVGETYTFPEIVGQVLESSDFISTISSSATAITISASGVEFT